MLKKAGNTVMKAMNLFAQFEVFFGIVKKSAVYIAIPVFFLYILLDKPDYRIISALHRPVMAIAIPIGQGVTWPVRAGKRFIASIIEYNSVSNDNENLRKMLDEKIAIENEYKFLKEEVNRLKKLLNIKESSKFNVIWGEIISNNRSLGNTFVINIGSRDNVKEGEIVLSERGSVLGFIIKAGREYSKVRNLNDINSNIIVKVSGTEIFGFLQGNNTRNPYFEYYSDPEFIPTVGKQIVSSGMNSLMPENIPIGEIVRVYSKTRAAVKLYDSVPNVKTVQVIEYDFGDKYREVLK
jgi:rod shape-determining protein MreC